MSASAPRGLLGYGAGRRRLRPFVRGSPSWATIVFGPLTFTLLLCLEFDLLFHWAILPISLCGSLVLKEVIDWIAGRLDTFDIRFITSALGLHFFFVAPILHICSDEWIGLVVGPSDWRPWLGRMALLNAVGLTAYRVGIAVVSSRAQEAEVKSWKLEIAPRMLGRYLPVAILATLVLQVLVYRQWGGVIGYAEAFSSRESDPFAGQGWLFALSESFPILCFFGFAVWVRKRRTISWVMIAGALLCFLMLKLGFGGLRGSRANTIWGLFWAAGIVHLWLRRFPRVAVFVGLISLIGFLYVYGFYKAAGIEGIMVLDDPRSKALLEERTNRTLTSALLNDLARSDIQAFLLYRISNQAGEFDLGWGRTYLGALVLPIPRAVWADKPASRVRVITDALYGRGSFEAGAARSSRILGLGGEAMLNFGPAAVPFAYLLFGVLVGTVGTRIQSLRPGDSRILLAPLAINACFWVLAADLDNVVYFLVKNGLLPAVVILLGSRRRSITNAS